VECVVTANDVMQNLDAKPKPKESPVKVEPFVSPILPEKK